MTHPYRPDRAGKTGSGDKTEGRRGHLSWEGDLNTVGKSQRDTEIYTVLCRGQGTVGHVSKF